VKTLPLARSALSAPQRAPRRVVAMSAPIHADVAQAIGQQVEQMIVQAQNDSEARVRHDLSAARQQLQQMDGLIGELGDRVGRCGRNTGGRGDPSEIVDRAFLNENISQLEAKWGSEVKALKQDLHRTILAHNHNSDLMRHHRDALDEARRKLDAQTQPKAEQVDAQMEKVERMLHAGQAKQRALDALTDRLAALEHQVGEVPHYPPAMVPGMAGIPGMLPPGMEATAGSKRAGKKDETRPQEEGRQRLLQAAAKAAANETSFNTEAPVFVMPGAPAAPAKLSAGLMADEGEDGGDGACEGDGDDDEADEKDEE